MILQSKNRTPLIFPLIFGVLAWLLYESTNVHGLIWGDAGEFIAVSKILGIGHAYGHPLFWLLGRIAIMLMPGDPAAAMNHLTAFFSALTCGTATILAIRWLPEGLKSWQKWTAASLPVLVLMTSEIVWGQAVFTEVYNIQALFIILALLNWDNYFRDDGDIRHFAVATFFWALSITLGLYVGLLVVLPILFWFVWDKKQIQLSSSLLVILALIAGFSIWIYLPVRSLVKPPYMHSNIDSLHSLINYLSRSQYSAEHIAVSVAIPYFLWKSVKVFFSNLDIAGSILVLGGVFSMIRARTRQLLPYALTTGLLILIFGVILPLTLNFRQIYGMGVYFTPILLLSIPIMVSGAGLIVKQLHRSVFWILILIAMFSGVSRYMSIDLSGHTFTEKYLNYISTTLPQGASIAANSDETHYPLLYDVFAQGNASQYNLWYVRESEPVETWLKRLENPGTIVNNYGPYLKAISDYDLTSLAGSFFTSSNNDSLAKRLNNGFLKLFSLDADAIQELHPVERIDGAVLWSKHARYWTTWSERLKYTDPEGAREKYAQAIHAMYKAYEFDDFSYMASFYAGNLAQMMLLAGHLDNAESFAKQGLNRYPYSVECLQALAGVYYQTNRAEQAENIRSRIKNLNQKTDH